jgi:drug/metabolite transporter superfamily protein YnfA
MVFTNSNGRRIVRVISFSCRVSADPGEVQRGIDEAALANVIGGQLVWHALRQGAQAGTDAIRKLIESLFVSRIKFVAFHHIAHAFLSHPINWAMGVDPRFAEFIRLRGMNIVDLCIYVYPRLLAVDQDCQLLPLTAESFALGRCFVLHTIDHVIVWIARDIDEKWLGEAFGIGHFEELPTDVPVIETEASLRLNSIIRSCWELSGRYLPVLIVPQGDPRETVVGALLVDDSVASGRNIADWIHYFR